MKQQVVILAAGLGSRLGRPLPKSLTKLQDGRTIMEQQHENIREVLPQAAITTVVGYRSEEIIERFAGASKFIHNTAYDETNTSKSLLLALRRLPRNVGVLWMNGDVVFHPAILEEAKAFIEADESFVAVNTSSVGDEEIKYTLDSDGFIEELSKTVVGGLGEGVGINFISSGDRTAFERALAEVDAQAYFERGLEVAIQKSGVRVRPLDVSSYYAVEVDFEGDLAYANGIQNMWRELGSTNVEMTHTSAENVI